MEAIFKNGKLIGEDNSILTGLTVTDHHGNVRLKSILQFHAAPLQEGEIITIQAPTLPKNKTSNKVMRTPIEKVNYLFDKYKELTEGSFHNSLWQILVNQPERKNAAFVYVYPAPIKNWNTGIVDAGKKGYTPATFGIKPEVNDQDREAMLAEMNAMIFGITQERAEEIELQAF